MTINKLFVFGCSYATGEELLMHELGTVDEFRKATAKDPRKFFKKIKELNLQSKYKEIKERQKKFAWPQILADKLDYQCVNLAESGNSLDKIVYQLYKEILEDNISKDDIVIISVTKLTRNAIFKKDSVESFQLPSLYWPVENLIGATDDGDFKPVINEQTDKALLDWFTDDRVIWDFVKNIQTLKNIKNSTNLKIHFVLAIKDNTTATSKTLKDIHNLTLTDFLTYHTLDDCSPGRLAWGHPTQEAHQKYAEHIYGLLG